MVDNNPALTASATLPVSGPTVGAALVLAHHFSVTTSASEDHMARLAVVVEEIIANIMEHGDPPCDSQISLSLCCDGGVSRIEIEDCGTPFDPRGYVRTGPIPERGGGAGLALVRAWSRILTYESSDGRNRLVLEIPRHG